MAVRRTSTKTVTRSVPVRTSRGTRHVPARITTRVTIIRNK